MMIVKIDYNVSVKVYYITGLYFVVLRLHYLGLCFIFSSHQKKRLIQCKKPINLLMKKHDDENIKEQ
jgi:hypothetical protein